MIDGRSSAVISDIQVTARVGSRVGGEGTTSA